MKRIYLITACAAVFLLAWCGLLSQPPVRPNNNYIEAALAASAPSATPTVVPQLPVVPQPQAPQPVIIPRYIYLPFVSLQEQPSPTPTATFTPTPTPTPRPPMEFLVCASPNSAIPDQSTAGLRSDIVLDQWGKLTELEVFVKITHPYAGDLSAELNQRSSGLNTILFDRPGPGSSGDTLASTVPDDKISSPSGSIRCDQANIQAIFNTWGSQSVNNKCQVDSMVGVGIGGIFRPAGDLQKFIGSTAAGTYSLLVNDSGAGDTGKLAKWCLRGKVVDLQADLPAAAPIPAPVQLPDSAFVGGMSGQNQSLPLDCESRSAVDWARHFGVFIDELEFHYGLPTSDDPDQGFVGSVYGAWGNIPPNAYGVHLGPVAARLRAYGLSAVGKGGWSYDELRAQIAAGNPVEVLVTGHVYPGAPEYYRPPSTNAINIVARYEHSVIVYGYTPTVVYILDGASAYQVPLERFLDAWSAIGNMAVMKE